MDIQLVKGDITERVVDAIVNAANTSLLGGGGVDGAIHRKGGPEILEACKVIRARQGGCQVGEAVITTAGKLPSQYVIHTVGPTWSGGDNEESQKLRKCYQNSLRLAVEEGITTIAFPNISTGVYRFPKELAADIAITTVQNFADQDKINLLEFVCFDAENYALYKKRLES